MAPSPENDSAPKAPDKSDGKSKCQGSKSDGSGAPDGDNKESSVSGLDDGQLKALLDEAITYKSPKDRVGKSSLFNNLLTAAEDDLRNQRATSASGPEFVRYYNTTATRRHRNRRQPSSVSENLTHGGSLNDLAKEELFGGVAVNQQRPRKLVSSRQREGGSLPCNVNNVYSGVSYDRQFFDDACRRKQQKQKNCCMEIGKEHHPRKQFVGRDTEFMDVVKSGTAVSRIPTNFTTNAKIDIGVDEALSISTLDGPGPVKASDAIEMRRQIYESASSPHAKFGLLSANAKEMNLKRGVDDAPGKLFYFQKVDENCNAVATAAPSNIGDAKKKGKKKAPLDKNVTIMYSSQEVSGHRSDIINDLDKLIDYIDGNEDHPATSSKSNNNKGMQKSHKQQQLHKNLFDDQNKSAKKQRTRAKGKGGNLQKSNSLEEMSTSKLEDFSFAQEDGGKVALRPTKSNVERPRERRSWCNTEQINLYANAASAENLETADFRVVTKKKKSKKRRSSSSGRSGCRQTSNASYSHRGADSADRTPGSPEPARRKSAVSVPHSEKSNDSSSDVDSVHSLPIDTQRHRHQRQLDLDEDEAESDRSGFPISYAEIAKNASAGSSVEKPKVAKNGEKKREKVKAVQNEKPVVGSDGDAVAIKLHKVDHPIQKVICEMHDKLQLKQLPIVQNVSQGVQTSPKNDQPSVEKTVVSPTEINYVNYIQNFPSIPTKEKCPTTNAPAPAVATIAEKFVKNPAPEVQNWPTIGAPKLVDKTPICKLSLAPTQKLTKTYDNNVKNLVTKNNPEKSDCGGLKMMQNNVRVLDMQQIITNNNNNEQPMTAVYTYQNITLHIPDVRMIENMQLQQQMQNHSSSGVQLSGCCPPPPMSVQTYVPDVALDHHRREDSAMRKPPHQHKVNTLVRSSGNKDSDCNRVGVQVDVNDRTSAVARPAVVILSGSSEKDVSGITFGFDINEQLLSSGDVDDACADFLARFVAPKFRPTNDGLMDHEHIVNYIGIAWEDVINESGGNVKYYTEDL